MRLKEQARERLILALDVPDFAKAVVLLDRLQGKIGLVKVNSLAVAHPEIIEEIKRRGHKVFRDFKHHDIPGTVGNFISADADAGLEMTTLHISGGVKMMEKAVEVARAKAKGMGVTVKLLGITLLTSLERQNLNDELRVPGEVIDQVIHLAKLGEKAGLDGVVASAKEVKELRKVLKPETVIVTPGINPLWAVKREDQARVTTPKQAILGRADYLVVGSAIINNENPANAVDMIVEEISEGLAELGIHPFF